MYFFQDFEYRYIFSRQNLSEYHLATLSSTFNVKILLMTTAAGQEKTVTY